MVTSLLRSTNDARSDVSDCQTSSMTMAHDGDEGTATGDEVDATTQ